MFSNGKVLSWSRLERILSGIDVGPLRIVGEGRGPDAAATMATAPGAGATVPFAELHAAGSYNFLHGASDPDEYVAAAVGLGLIALAVVDRDGLYGAARLATAAAEVALPTVFGAELSVFGTDAAPLTVLCRGQDGYRRLSRAVTGARMARRDKDAADYPSLPELADAAGGHWYVLIDHHHLHRAQEVLTAFGTDTCLVELAQTGSPAEVDRNQALHDLARDHGLTEIVSTAATCATPSQARLAGAKAALHGREDVQTAMPRTHPLGGSWLRSGEEMVALAGDCDWLTDAIATSVRVAGECAFTLNLIAPQLPHFPVGEGHTEMSWLRALTDEGAEKRYGTRDENPKAWATIEHELGIIETLGFPGYFLIVHEIVDFCHRNDIFCQGRGSAANSAVCFALGITNVDAVGADLLFERFLSPERDGPPDIDLDIESGRREEAIQHVYARYGRENAAQVANVISYRRKGALRDAARALGYDPGRVDAWTRRLEDPPEPVTALADSLKGQPRHLGIHPGGMVICDRAIADVVPTEWARMDDRSVLQWDKDDCEAVGLVKFDLLGLGMLEALHHIVDLIEETTGDCIELWKLQPTEPEVFAMLARADAVGVFQVESRAQLTTLPRLKPREFYDLVVEVALIRPGPIQGGSVHPYIRRRNKVEEVTYDPPELEHVLEPVLGRTYGIPLFQEQLMQMAVAVAGFTPAEADTLRRSMGSKRSPEKMERLRERFIGGACDLHGIDRSAGERLWHKVIAFASYGFPESHAQSFASLVYFSAWFKYHYPAEFCVGLLRAQPMGFYSPQSLVSDARRHGVGVRPVDVNASRVEATVEDGDIRLGLGSVKGIGAESAGRVVTARADRGGPFTAIADLSREAGLTVDEVSALARAGACDSMGLTRRQALWAAGVAATERAGMLPGTSTVSTPSLPGMSAFELAAADVAATGVTSDGHPVRLLRARLDAWPGNFPVVPASDLLSVENGRRIIVAGVVTHRQRPMTAGGVTFLGMEDETGLVNVMVSPGLWQARRKVATTARMLMVRGIAQNADGAVTVTADALEPLETADALATASRDFR